MLLLTEICPPCSQPFGRGSEKYFHPLVELGGKGRGGINLLSGQAVYNSLLSAGTGFIEVRGGACEIQGT